MKPVEKAAASPLPSQDDRIKHFPEEVRAAFRRYQVEGDLVALDPVVFAILADFVPQEPSVPFAELPGHTELIGDLGFDSLAITEVVFFTEDLFQITISNEEIVQVRTLDDLRGFIRTKVSKNRTAA